MERIAGIGVAVIFLLASGVLAQVARPAAGQRGQARPATWNAERASLLRQVVERTRSQVQAVRVMAEIGTVAPADVRASETFLADLEQQVDADLTRAAGRPEPTRPEHAALRIRFAEAMNAVDAGEVRFDNGMISTAAMNATLSGAAAVFLGAPVK